MDNDVNTQDIMDSAKAREIVSEINSFGVNQFQIKKIIKLLSLELEDRKLMSDIVSILESSFEEIKPEKIKIEV